MPKLKGLIYMTSSISDETRLLAAYSTYKALYEERKTTYDIVAGFINASITNPKKGILYSQEDLGELIKESFGLTIPSVVIGFAAKKVKCLKKEGSDYRLIIDALPQEENFSQKIERFTSAVMDVFSEFNVYLGEHQYEDIEKANQAFMDFLLDEGSVDDDLKSIITSFIIKICASSPDFKDALDNIRRGHCLLTGLTNNKAISQTNTWNGNLTIYLDTEILFHLAGYNGELWKKIAEDFVNVTRQANRGKGSIKLKFFQSTKEEVMDYFYSTRCRMKNPDYAYPVKDAMRHLLKKCKNESDLIEEQDLFFSKLTQYGIYEDEKEDYKKSEYDKYNLESGELSDKYYNNTRGKNPIRGIERSREKINSRISSVSNINKLRKGIPYYDYRDCLFIFVTGTGQTISISHDLIADNYRGNGYRNRDGEKAIEYAVSLSTITNAIWYRLNNVLLGGSAVNYPAETDAVIRSQIVMASLMTQTLDNIYASGREALEKGKLTKEELAARLESISGKQRNPEDITAETVEEDATILEIGDIEAIRNEKEYLRDKNRQKDERISELEKEHEDDVQEIRKLRSDKELRELNDRLKEIREIIKRYENAVKKADRCDRVAKIFLVLVVLFFEGLLIYLINRIGWNQAEKYTYYINLIVDAFVLCLGVLGCKYSLKSFADRIACYGKKKYEDDLNIDIDIIQSEKKSALNRLEELKRESGEHEMASG